MTCSPYKAHAARPYALPDVNRIELRTAKKPLSIQIEAPAVYGIINPMNLPSFLPSSLFQSAA